MALIKTADELSKIRAAGSIQRQVMAALVKRATVGTTPKQLDELAEQMILKAGAKPAFKNYQPSGAQKAYPATICASVNDVIVHNIPDNTPLKNGDVFKIDIGVNYQGLNTDSAVTLIIGRAKNKQAYKLLEATQQALENAIAAAKPGNTLGDIGHIITKTVSKYGFHIVKGLSGHGIGHDVHEEPHVFNFGKPGQGLELKPGMVIAIEPMVAISTSTLIQTPNQAYASQDSSLTAHFEHTVIITPQGPEVVT